MQEGAQSHANIRKTRFCEGENTAEEKVFYFAVVTRATINPWVNIYWVFTRLWAMCDEAHSYQRLSGDLTQWDHHPTFTKDSDLMFCFLWCSVNAFPLTHFALHLWLTVFPKELLYESSLFKKIILTFIQRMREKVRTSSGMIRVIVLRLWLEWPVKQALVLFA